MCPKTIPLPSMRPRQAKSLDTHDLGGWKLNWRRKTMREVHINGYIRVSGQKGHSVSEKKKSKSET